jgi:phosphoribosylformylglycinamidine synthase
MLDFLLEARDDGLFQGITDNGAGGLSSSLGEMAEESGGVRIQLERCPLKYEGLAPWEILLSESQERMSVAVAPENLPAFLLLARRRDVEATVVGEFTDSGMVEVLHEGRYVGLLSLSFLHHGLPTMRLPARWSPPARPEPPVLSDRSLRADLLSLLQDPNIASKEALVRQYDHEVQGGSVVKPFVGPESDGPSDGAVVRLRPEHTQGITVTHGVCPRYGDVDTYHMAMCAVDEAFRAHVALGGDPERAAALDNFCWPDPIESADNPDGAYKMAQLVRACRGLHDACVAYDLPLISGKDSMKNDARIGGKKVSVRPTLLVSLMGSIQDVRAAVTSDFKAPGQAVYLVGETRGELGGSSFERLVGVPLGACPTVCPEAALAGFYAVHTAIRAGFVTACHDLADGGLGVALAESVLAGRVGARVTLPALQAPKEPWAALYSETPSRLLVTVAEEHAGAFEEIAADASYTRIGSTVAEEILEIAAADGTSFVLALDELVAAFRGAL